MPSKSSRRDAVAVLGAAGAMGRAAVYRLARDGRRVLALDGDVAAVRRIVRRYGGGRAAAEAADARDRERLARQLAAVGAVVNCAAYPLNLDVMRPASRT
jgi:saccharopine dehydrogenase-like NADP-dependent oxidoreductase